MIAVRLSHVLGKPRGKLRPARYDVYVGGECIGEITMPVEPGRKRTLTVHRRTGREKKFVGVYTYMESAVRGLLNATGFDQSRPFTVTNDPVQLPWHGHATKRGDQPFHFDQCYYLGDLDDGMYLMADRNPDDGKWYALLAVGSNTIGIDYLMDELGRFDSFRDAAEAGLQVALAWLKTWVHVDDRDVEAIRADISLRSTKS